MFTCMECGQEFERVLQLQIHQQNIHPRQSTSRKCPQATASTLDEGATAHVQTSV